jgi:hypothetical protein
MKQTFKAKLIPRGPGGAWTFLNVPFKVEQVFGSKARVAVAGTLNGFPFRNSLMPEGDGTHAMMVSKILQAGARARAGDTVAVVMEIDRKKRVVRVPAELAAALKSNPAGAKIYKTLSPSHRKEFAEWVGGAKQKATRLARAQKALPLILKRAHAR